MSLHDLIPAVTVPEGQSGEWRVERFTVSEEAAKFDHLRSMFSSRRYTPAGRYTRLMRGGTVVMSDTRDEKRDHVSFVQAARDHVLIHGLGLGMVLQAVLQKPEVECATVIESSADVIALVAPHYAGPRVEIIHADAMTWTPPKASFFGAVWHDIWDDICADNLEQMKTLHRRYGRRSAWQGSWAREYCERQA
jgi:spermidine synthase